MKHEHILGPAERSLLCDLITVLQRIKREQASQLWLNEQFSSLKTEIQKMVTQADFDTAIADLKTDLNAETDAVSGVKTLVQSLLDQLTAAIASAGNAGATDAQLADLKTLHASFSAQTGDLANLVVANTPGVNMPASRDPSA